ncbi:MAG: FAD:protein FMN transferase [Candidatus Moranbacteria bacterium]|nr:FAD:protein FMN transferase [Candidatus Moranbacteria bacterium]
MEEFTFTGLGTEWSLAVDGKQLEDQVRKDVVQYVQDFENRFSRFLPLSEVNAFRTSPAGDYILSQEFSLLLARADRLRILTNSAYDPAVASILEDAGYGAKSGMEKIKQPHIPKWALVGNKLTIDSPIAFDLGGIGKGYCIDQVADVLKHFGYDYYLVDGGGDMAGTTKADGSAWRVAVEYPGKPDTAASIVHLKHQGIAVSDSFRRRFGKWHHLIDMQEKKPVEKVIGCAAVAQDAWAADCMTSGLFFAPPENYPALAEEFEATYIVFQSDGTTTVNSDWQGELL